MTTEISFTANGLFFTVTEGNNGWCWQHTAYATTWDVIKDADGFATAAEAQQAAIDYAATYKEQAEDEDGETTADLRRELSPRVL